MTPPPPPSDDPGPGTSGPGTSDTATVVPRWSVAPAAAFGVAAGVLLAGLALLFGRPELALVALPLFVVAALGWNRRPPRIRDVPMSTTLVADSDGRGVRYTVGVHSPPGTETVSLQIVTAGGAVHRVTVTAGTARALTGLVPLAHSGPQQIVAVRAAFHSTAGVATTVPVDGPVSTRVVPPPRLRVDELPLPLRVLGLTGNHNSTTPGDGGEFRDVALFTSGDRLRRIDWKVTARRAQLPGDLYVRRSFSTAEATVTIVLDDRDDVGADVTTWSGTSGPSTTATSLDLAREAASTLAATYLGAGDRVGFRDLAGTARQVQPGGGTRQLDRLLSTIATAVPTGEPDRQVRTPLVPSASIVIVLSTFLDDQAAAMAGTWAGAGHRVIAVDVLPVPRLRATSAEQSAAFRLTMVERNARLESMAIAGVERLAWQSGSDETIPAVQLRMLSRPRRMR